MNDWDDCGHHPEWVNKFDVTDTCNHPDCKAAAMNEPTLAEFLLARLAEDEANAPPEHYQPFEREWEWCPAVGPGFTGECDCNNPRRRARVLADVEAKRAIVSMSTWISNQERVPTDRPGVYDVVNTVRVNEDMEPVLFALASIYADHPDHDKSWRP